MFRFFKKSKETNIPIYVSDVTQFVMNAGRQSKYYPENKDYLEYPMKLTWLRSGDIVTALTGRSVKYVLINVNDLISHN